MRPIVGTLLALSMEGAMAANTSSLVELLERGAIELTPTGLGGHSGDCLRVEARNLTPNTLSTTIPAGWVFVSREAHVQDLIVMREEPLAIAPHGRSTVTCRAFCCEASSGGPEVNEAYRKGHPASPALMALAHVVERGTYSDDLVQSAVWVLSDGNDIGSVGAIDGSASDTLRSHLSALSGQPLPRYTLRYAPDSARACSQRPASISRSVRMSTLTPQHITIMVRSDAGRIMAVPMDHTYLLPGTTVIPVEVDVLGWPEGRYAIQVFTTEESPVHRLPFTL